MKSKHQGEKGTTARQLLERSQERLCFSPHCLPSEGTARKEGKVSSLYSCCISSPVHGLPDMGAVRRGALCSLCLAEGLFTPVQ